MEAGAEIADTQISEFRARETTREREVGLQASM